MIKLIVFLIWFSALLICLGSVIYRDRKYPFASTSRPRWYETRSHLVAKVSWGIMVLGLVTFLCLYLK